MENIATVIVLLTVVTALAEVTDKDKDPIPHSSGTCRDRDWSGPWTTTHKPESRDCLSGLSSAGPLCGCMEHVMG